MEKEAELASKIHDVLADPPEAEAAGVVV